MSLFLLMGALLIAIPPEAKSQFLEKTSKTEVYASVNQYRADNGLPALQVSPALERSAEVYAFKLNVFYSDPLRHDAAWINRQEFRCAELLGEAYKPIDQWKRSATHNAVLLAKGFTHIGVGKSGGGYVLRVMQCDRF